MPLLFALTLFVSATLLFLLQPMVARMILPLLGGTPAVWNTCMVFFQAALLAGYSYAHAAPAWLGLRRQLVLHLALLLMPLAVLPIAVSSEWAPPGDANPIPWLLALLTVSVGLPFFVVATSAPLLQKWFAGTGHPSAKDPYFLYGASNLGSMLALIAYPLLVEPSLRLADQSLLWQAGYIVLAVLTLACSVAVWRSLGASSAPQGDTTQERADHSPAPSLKTRLHWIALAFVPSSLMLGVTTYLTTDIAAIPLFWVLPLALYLLSFIVVFVRRPLLPHGLMCRLLPPVMLCLVFVMLSGDAYQLRAMTVMPLHLVALFVAAMVCHGELAARRPPARHLTGFYLCLSLGGVLGGLFNALLAPLLFRTILEYPLALMLACLLLPRTDPGPDRPRSRWLDLVLPLSVGVGAAALILGLAAPATPEANPLVRFLPGSLSALLVYGLPVVACFTFAGRPLRFGLGVGAVLLAGMLCRDPYGRVLYRERGFFGDLHVRIDPTGQYVQLVHGTTLHGQQYRDPQSRAEPLAYFHRSGPVGQVFEALREGRANPRRVGVMGLGIGALLSYSHSGQEWTYYEIDPAVVRVARDERFFTCMSDAERRGVQLNVVLGDARLQLVHAPARHYDLLTLDVFSSDAVPVHLLTREALRLYQAKLADRGVMLFNISNRYLRLESVVAALAQDAGLVGLVRYDDADPNIPGKSASSWLVLARREADLPRLPGWRLLVRPEGAEPWTDDFSNLLETLIWRQ
ncbi:MAG: fused MFS/spermidine synthase [Gemmataceae bacterium]|nr:fused MFS/spermidine synthase [Gemmataceae bacterium]